MKKSLLFLAGFSVVALSASADRLQQGYITWPGSENLADYVQQWNGGAGSIQINGQTWEDENFFVSRVKPKVRFYNTASQVNPSLSQYNPEDGSGTDKRYIWWVPIGDCPPDGSYHTNALPNGTFDGEAFSMWSYMDHYGNWTSPWGWAPGAFADAAHKNGVAVSGVASVPNTSINTASGWGAAFDKFKNADGNNIAKFLYYHGVDGLGYNSEWSGVAPSTYITPNHDVIAEYMKSRNPIFENIWYGGTQDGGSIGFDRGVASHSANIFRNASMFLNYNWNNETMMSSSIQYAKSVGRNPFFIYAGMNQQGGEPKSGENYPIVARYQYSIGVWGAHNYNMFWQGRTAEGASLDCVQRCYLNQCERWFSNGKRNPAIKMNITTNRGHSALESFAGMSSMMTARSVLGWSLADEPFITYFNLGNGRFFNLNGERVSDKGWYNIGMQDYLPTWRWWFSPEFLQHEVTEGTTHMSADFTWDDAYFGGSCLQISGTTAKEYLHLFKTNFKFNSNYTIRLRYKVLEGQGDVRLVMSTVGSEDTPVSLRQAADNEKLKFITVENSAEQRDASLDGWQTMELQLKAADCQGSTAVFAKNVAVIGLEFVNAENLKIELGEFSVKPRTTAVAPAKPEVTLAKVLYQDMNGIDGKLIWNMPNTKNQGDPVYNSDVKTSYFKVYAQEEGGEPVFMNTTTSWASILFGAPSEDASKKIRFGVSAVDMRHEAESEIAWSNYLDKGEYVQKDDVELDKTTIKPNETFTISYVDPSHSASNFSIYDVNGNKVASGNGVSYEVTGGLANIGGYDLVIDEGTSSERRMNYFIQISSENVGAMPEVYTVSRNESEISGDSPVSIELADVQTLGYTGRYADGQASRAIRLNNGHIGGSNSEFGLQGGDSFTIAGWFKFDKFPDDTWALMNITNKGGAWPTCNWGWCWSYVEPGGVISLRFRGSTSGGTPGELHYTYPQTRLQPNVWTHIAITCEYSASGFRSLLFINGVEQKSDWTSFVTGNGGSVRLSGHNDEWVEGQTYAISKTDDLIFGGVEYQHTAIDGIIDDFQIWKKALTEDDVKIAMNEVSRNNVPSGLLAYWDFEDDCDPETMMFASVGENKNISGYNFDLVKEGEAEGVMRKVPKAPLYTSGCPFITGTAFPVVTKAEWADTDVRTRFDKVQSRAAGTEGEAGQATVKFNREGDHIVTLKLVNSYGEDAREFPVFSVKDNAAIGDVAADGVDINTYTVDDILFLEFGQDGAYDVEVYNTAGMLAGQKQLSAVAGQNAQITLGVQGIYLVRVSLDGKALRTIKVVRK